MMNMAGTTMKKPGIMGRAIIAWLVLNLSMFLVLGLIVYFLQPWLSAWYVIVPLIVSLIVTEWVITADTIAPIVREWIKSEEYVKEGEKPSWEKNKTT